jgi:hypothetical protein
MDKEEFGNISAGDETVDQSLLNNNDDEDTVDMSQNQ